MATNEPMWKTLVEAAADLKDDGEGDFSWSELMKRARSLDLSHYESAFGPVFQSMVIESPTPAVTPLGKVFTRVSRGTYELQSVPKKSARRLPNFSRSRWSVPSPRRPCSEMFDIDPCNSSPISTSTWRTFSRTCRSRSPENSISID